MEQESNIEDTPRRSGCAKFLFYAWLPIVLLCVASPFLLNTVASSNLDKRVLELEKDLEVFRSEQNFTRPPRFGAGTKGNAVDCYLGMDYVLPSRGLTKTPPPKNSPDLVSLKAMLRKKYRIKESLENKLLLLSNEDNRRKENLRSAGNWGLTEKEQDYVEACLPLLTLVEDGLRCQRVQWPVDFERCGQEEFYYSNSYRFTALLLAHKARESTPDMKVEYGLKILAFGEDLSRLSTLEEKLMALSVQYIGRRSLLESMASPWRKQDYTRIIAFIESLHYPGRSRILRSEYLRASCMLAQLSQRKINGIEMKDRAEILGADRWRNEPVFGSDLFLNYEWNFYGNLHNNYLLPLKTMSLDEMMKSEEELEEFLATDLSLFAKIKEPCYRDSFAELDKNENASRMVSILAAAHLHRLKTGQFPQEIEALAEYFPNKKLPKNTMTETPSNFQYEFKAGQVTISLPLEFPIVYRTWMPKH